MRNEQVDDAINEHIKSQGYVGIKGKGSGKGRNGGFESVTLTSEHVIDQDILNKALQSHDELMTVLLLTFEIEIQLSNFLNDRFGSAQKGTNFGGMVLKLKALGFDNDIAEIVDNFRKLRNEFAHNKEASLEKHSKIVKAILGCKLPTFLEQDITTVKGIDCSESVKFEDLAPTSLLYLYACFTTGFLAAANQMYNFPKPSKRVVFRST